MVETYKRRHSIRPPKNVLYLLLAVAIHQAEGQDHFPKLQGVASGAASMTAVAYTDLGTTGPIGRGIRVRAVVSADFKTNDVQRKVELQVLGDTTVIVDVALEEVPTLLAAIDSLYTVRRNPTIFRDFTIEYESQGGLVLQVHSDSAAGIASEFSVLARYSKPMLQSVSDRGTVRMTQETRVTTARRSMNDLEIVAFRRLVAAAAELLRKSTADLPR